MSSEANVDVEKLVMVAKGLRILQMGSKRPDGVKGTLFSAQFYGDAGKGNGKIPTAIRDVAAEHGFKGKDDVIVVSDNGMWREGWAAEALRACLKARIPDRLNEVCAAWDDFLMEESKSRPAGPVDAATTKAPAGAAGDAGGGPVVVGRKPPGRYQDGRKIPRDAVVRAVAEPKSQFEREHGVPELRKYNTIPKDRFSSQDWTVRNGEFIPNAAERAIELQDGLKEAEVAGKLHLVEMTESNWAYLRSANDKLL